MPAPRRSGRLANVPTLDVWEPTPLSKSAQAQAAAAAAAKQQQEESSSESESEPEDGAGPLRRTGPMTMTLVMEWQGHLSFRNRVYPPLEQPYQDAPGQNYTISHDNPSQVSLCYNLT